MYIEIIRIHDRVVFITTICKLPDISLVKSMTKYTPPGSGGTRLRPTVDISIRRSVLSGR